MPRQPSTSIERPSTASDPEKRAAGAGDSSFVRGSRARYIHAARQMEQRLLGRLERQVPPNVVADRPAGAVRRRSAPPPLSASRRRRVSGSGSVSFAARGPSGLNSVNHSEPVGAAPGRLCTVYRIQAPSGSDGMAQLQVEALVVAGTRRHVREAGCCWVDGRHGRAA